MRSINYTLLIISFSIITVSCAKNKIEDPKPDNELKISSINRQGEWPYNASITYDNSGKPTTVKTSHLTLQITYLNNQIKSISSASNRSFIPNIYDVNYISAKELVITDSDSKSFGKVNLKLTDTGMLESSVFSSTNIDSNTFDFKYSFKYDASDNMILSELFTQDGYVSRIVYENYDNKINPYYSNVRIWSVLNGIFELDIMTKIPFPICRNNPQVIHYDDYKEGSKLQYNYNEKGLPTEITEYFYKGARKGPPIDSDYWLVEGNVKMEY